MNLLIVGINHTSAPVELREKVAFTHEQLPNALKDISRVADFSEVAVLSTCNRTEIIAITEDANEKKVVDWLAAYHEMQVPAAFSQNRLSRNGYGPSSWVLLALLGQAPFEYSRLSLCFLLN